MLGIDFTDKDLSEFKMGEIKDFNMKYKAPENYNIEVSSDGEHWEDLSNFIDSDGNLIKNENDELLKTLHNLYGKEYAEQLKKRGEKSE